MTRRHLLFGVLMALAAGLLACSAPSLNSASPATCEQKVAHAMTSPRVPVAGAYACFDSTNSGFAIAMANAGIHDDTSLAAFAASDPIYTSYRLCQRPTSQDAAFRFYELRGQAGTQLMRLHVTPTGKVDDVKFGGSGSTCADLPK